VKQQQKAPQSQAQAKKWPIDALAQSAGIVLQGAESKPITSDSPEQGREESPAPTKRKRTRTRRKKASVSPDGSQATQIADKTATELDIKR
jgi:hypothetical protein